MILSRSSAAALAVCSALLAASCGAGSSDGSSDESGGGSVAQAPTLVATTSIWADIVSSVICNQPVPALIPAGVDPHGFEASLRDRELLENAAVIIANGADLEDSSTELLEAAQSGGVPVVEMTSFVTLIDGDPHIWQDPTRVVATIREIVDVAVDAGIDAETTGECADHYVTDLLQLDAEITERLAALPTESRLMVTSHDSLAYFADRYELEIVGTVIPSTNTLAETNAADLATLAETIETLGVPAVFTEQLESSGDADRLAERLGVAVVPLVTDAVTDDPATDTYIEMMRSNATEIAEALEP